MATWCFTHEFMDSKPDSWGPSDPMMNQWTWNNLFDRPHDKPMRTWEPMHHNWPDWPSLPEDLGGVTLRTGCSIFILSDPIDHWENAGYGIRWIIPDLKKLNNAQELWFWLTWPAWRLLLLPLEKTRHDSRHGDQFFEKTGRRIVLETYSMTDNSRSADKPQLMTDEEDPQNM